RERRDESRPVERLELAQLPAVHDGLEDRSGVETLPEIRREELVDFLGRPRWRQGFERWRGRPPRTSRPRIEIEGDPPRDGQGFLLVARHVVRGTGLAG